ncbi:MAG: hypothetical protein WA594_15610 [Candidatus Sulfotelmatobacter sp.]
MPDADGTRWQWYVGQSKSADSAEIDYTSEGGSVCVLLAFPDQQVGICYDPSATAALSYTKRFFTVYTVIGWNVNERAPSQPPSVNERVARQRQPRAPWAEDLPEGSLNLVPSRTNRRSSTLFMQSGARITSA